MSWKEFMEFIKGKDCKIRDEVADIDPGIVIRCGG